MQTKPFQAEQFEFPFISKIDERLLKFNPKRSSEMQCMIGLGGPDSPFDKLHLQVNIAPASKLPLDS